MTRLSCTFLQVFLLNFVRSFSDFLPRRRRGGGAGEDDRVTVHGFYHAVNFFILEPIPKLTMNANELTPDNDSTGKLK